LYFPSDISFWVEKAFHWIIKNGKIGSLVKGKGFLIFMESLRFLVGPPYTR
jgi:hypothetical protein